MNSSARLDPATSRGWAYFFLLAGPFIAIMLSNTLLPRFGGYWSFMHPPAGEPASAEFLIRTTPVGKYPILIVGSSVAIWDLNENILNEMLLTTGMAALNLGVGQAGPPDIAMRTAQALELKPRYVLFVALPHNLRKDPPLEIEWSYDPLIAWRLYGPASFFEAPAGHFEGVSLWASVLYRHREWIRKAIVRDGLKRPIHPRKKRRQGERSFNKMVRGWANITEILHIDGQGPYAEAFRFISEACRKAGATPILLLTPIHPDAGGKLLAKHLETVLSLKSQLGYDHVMVPNLKMYPDPVFRDALHLLPPGQRTYTEEVAKFLRPILEADARAVQ